MDVIFPENPLKLPSAFRMWVNNLWVENCEERQRYGDPQLNSQEYWQRFKWWLRREYRHRQNLKRK
jgi:hypothetical protein